MNRTFICLIPCCLMLLLGCAMQSGSGLYGNKLMAKRGYGQQFEVLVDVPIVTVKIQTVGASGATSAGSGWKVKITNHNNAPIKFLLNESSYESPGGVVSKLSRGKGSAGEAYSPVEIPVDGKHHDYLVCDGQTFQDPYKPAKLKLVFEINGEQKTWIAAIRSGRIFRRRK